VAKSEQNEAAGLGFVVFGGLFGVAGLAMLVKIVRGEAEAKAVGRGSRAAIGILGEGPFTFLVMLVCLALGVLGIYLGVGFLRQGPRRSPRRVDLDEDPEGEVPETVLLLCPHCEAVSKLPGEFAGRKGKCPKCKGVVRVPEE
jgi:hypothetical protein